uniref:Epidermal patterning factor-like protein n=1 Tax=Leersia perrieri TaxID=77586 RepID=A0A0D9VPV1_9ORYZ
MPGSASTGRHRRRRRTISTAAISPLLVLLIFFLGARSCSATGLAGVGEGAKPEERRPYYYYYYSRWESAAARRRLVGPGSSPPTCRSRCGGCHPCRPVHVAIQPGVAFPLEYYPEAWRCKCGDKLFMP